MEAVNRQDEKHDEVGKHHREVEGIGMVDPGKSPIGDLVPIVVDGILRRETNRQ